MKNIWKFAAVIIASSISITSQAALITIDPDDFASGTDISNQFADVTLSTCVNEPSTCSNVQPVFTLNSGHATTGDRVFAQTQTNATWGNGVFEWLQADFNVAVNSVSLDFAANDSGGDSNPQLLAFDSFGIQIDIDSGGFVASGEFLTLTVNGNNIAYVQAYWDEINRSQSGALDNLVYNTVEVPAPTGMVFLALSLLGLVVFKGSRSFKP